MNWSKCCLRVSLSATAARTLVILHAQTCQRTLIVKQKKIIPVIYFTRFLDHCRKYLYMYYLCKLLTYSHQSCTVRASDMYA